MRPDRLRIGGFVPFSTVDFPGRFCAVIFCQGCPWRCRYCHNPHLQSFTNGTKWTWDAIAVFLESRRGLLDAVVFSGGEPTVQPALEPAMRAVRKLGFQVGLHTAGIDADRLRRVLPLVDWVGLDIKAPFDAGYAAVTGVRASGRAAESALEAILEEGIAYEIRTTVHPALLDEPAKETIQRGLAARGAQPTRWQEFRPYGCADSELIEHVRKG